MDSYTNDLRIYYIAWTIQPWTKFFSYSDNNLKSVVDLAIKSGDFEHASFASDAYLLYSMMQGKNLERIYHQYIETIAAFNRLYHPVFQTKLLNLQASNLMGKMNSPFSFDTPVLMNQIFLKTQKLKIIPKLFSIF